MFKSGMFVLLANQNVQCWTL